MGGLTFYEDQLPCPKGERRDDAFLHRRLEIFEFDSKMFLRLGDLNDGPKDSYSCELQLDDVRELIKALQNIYSRNDFSTHNE